MLLSGLTVGHASAGFTPPALKGTPQFVISGHGWGHGVGMSQWGAYGYAQNGFTFDKILAHYYPGTVLGHDDREEHPRAAREHRQRDDHLDRPVEAQGRLGGDGDASRGQGDAEPAAEVQASRRDRGGGVHRAADVHVGRRRSCSRRPYRGTFTVTSDGKKLTLVNTVPLEQYLESVVPSEMPKTWHPEALKTQAVAARSYALAVRKTNGAFDVYPDTRSQVYGGVTSEYPTTSAAVNATAGQVLTYGGKIATTYFFSTSGGRTAAVADVWKSSPIPYLVSVTDPYDSLSPYHDWGPFVFGPDKLKAALKLTGRLLDVKTTVNTSERVDTLQAIGEKSERVLSGEEVRTALGLRSSWFSVGVLALDPLPAATVKYGTPFTLSGLGRDLPDLHLEQRAPGTSAWTMNRGVEPAADGSFAITVKAAAPEEYRVTSDTVSTPSTKVVVAPRVLLKTNADLTGLKGTVRPVVPGVPVQIQQLNGDGRWATIAKATPTRSGHFVAQAAVFGGAYRARVVAGHGWAVGISPKVLVE